VAGVMVERRRLYWERVAGATTAVLAVFSMVKWRARPVAFGWCTAASNVEKRRRNGASGDWLPLAAELADSHKRRH